VLIRSPRRRRSRNALPLAAWLVACTLAAPAAADPGPGIVTAVVPPDSRGGVFQFSGYLGTPHQYQSTLRPLLMGMSLEDRVLPWLIVTLAMEANPAPGEDMFFAAIAAGPTLMAGRPNTPGPLVVIAPRVGIDAHSYDAMAVHAGGHVLLDAPIAFDGALRFFVGPRYAVLKEYRGRGDQFDVRKARHYVGVIAGVTAHLAPRFDLSATFTYPFVRVDLEEQEGGAQPGCCDRLEPTGSLRLTLHVGKLPQERAVVGRTTVVEEDPEVEEAG